MNNTYLKLYNKWMEERGLSSVMIFQGPTWDSLLNWCKENKEEFKSSILEHLKEEPTWAVQLLDEIYGKDLDIKAEGYVGLEAWCNLWICILENSLENMKPGDSIPWHYKDYDEFKEYQEKHYIPWNPFHEENPNITFEEFKQGKRNTKKS